MPAEPPLFLHCSNEISIFQIYTKTSDRVFLSNVPALAHDPFSLTKMVEKVNPALYSLPSSTTRHQSLSPPPSDADSDLDPVDYKAGISDALDLLKRCLNVNPVRRITAKEALEHRFLRREGIDEGLTGPRDVGEGKCGNRHFLDEKGNRGLLFSRLEMGRSIACD